MPLTMTYEGGRCVPRVMYVPVSATISNEPPVAFSPRFTL